MNRESSIWFLPSENKWGDMNLLAMKDSGDLIFNDDELIFQGKSHSISIKNIQAISYGKQGRDFVNNWVKVEFLDSEELKSVYFADGGLLGWSGILGGTNRLRRKIEQKYL